MGLTLATIGYVVAVALGYIPGRIAERKGYEIELWWLFGTLAFVVALPVALLLTPRPPTPRPGRTPAA